MTKAIISLSEWKVLISAIKNPQKFSFVYITFGDGPQKYEKSSKVWFDAEYMPQKFGLPYIYIYVY